VFFIDSSILILSSQILFF